MKLRNAIVVSAVLTSLCISTSARASITCPLFPIQTYPNGTLYFCDKFPGTCGEDVTSGYLFGEYAVPYENCPGDCETTVSAPDEILAKTKSFPGLKSYVSFDYMHERKRSDGAVQLRTRVNERRYNQFVKLVVGNKIIYAKLLEFQVLRTGSQGQNVWKSRFVAFEVEQDPSPQGGNVSTINIPEKLDADGFIYRGNASLGLESGIEVLILLHQSIR